MGRAVKLTSSEQAALRAILFEGVVPDQSTGALRFSPGKARLQHGFELHLSFLPVRNRASHERCRRRAKRSCRRESERGRSGPASSVPPALSQAPKRSRASHRHPAKASQAKKRSGCARLAIPMNRPGFVRISDEWPDITAGLQASQMAQTLDS